MKIEHLASYDSSCESKIRSIGADTFKTLLIEKELQILDVRSQEEYENIHLPNAMNIPLSNLGQNIQKIAKDRPVYIICQSGVRSVKAISILQKKFAKQEFINVEGGMNKVYAYADTH